MKLVPKCCLGLFACLALALLVVSGVRAQTMGTEGSPNNPNPAMTTAEAETGPGASAQQSPNVRAQQRMAECGAMMRHGHMMGPEMGMGMMGMPMMQEHMAMMRMMERNPKMAGHMMEMRADMMRAMADVMSKYGKEMESGQWQTSSATQSNPSTENNANEGNPSSSESSSSEEY
jgi:hypothetical protein